MTCSGPDEASIIANYYPLVQSYLRQQQHEGVEQDAPQVQLSHQHTASTLLHAHELAAAYQADSHTHSVCYLQAKVSDGFVYDYYAAATDTQTEPEADLTHVPTVQVSMLL